MRLLEANWDSPGGVIDVPRDYPNEIGERFLNWIRRSSAWRENPAIVERQVLKMNRELQDYREQRPAPAIAVHAAGYPEEETATRMGDPPPGEARAAELKAKRQASMAKARAARAAKRAAKNGAAA